MVENITFRKKAQVQAVLDPPHDDAESVTDALHRLSAEITRFRQSTDDTLKSINGRLDELCDRIGTYDSRLKALEKLETENTILKATVADLQIRLDNQAQASLRNEVEIYGIEETQEENPYHLVMTTAVKLGIDVQDSDLAHVSRVGPKRQAQNTETSEITQNSKLPRPIAVAFVRRVKRDDFLKHAKVRRNIKSGDIVGRGGSNSRIYVNERLTGTNRQLFRGARLFAKEHNFKHCWVRNGNIFVRKHDASRGSPAILIRSEADLAALAPVAPEAASETTSASGRPRPSTVELPC
ncbi:uncharacterized protein LOC125234185 [Leguminivora glycinivorella]|uniref:uncharacterized protein LOC125234185 n=1 Tax=Leguminivora glycinivorella TaxID=1035111 RepID=UPI00200C42A7|nr:uncharacterized protein LOC125234185 [Leguminivora glycinivorella]